MSSDSAREAKRMKLTRQKIEDIRASIDDVIAMLTPDGDRLLIFQSLIIGRLEGVSDTLTGTLNRLRLFESSLVTKNIPISTPPNTNSGENG